MSFIIFFANPIGGTISLNFWEIQTNKFRTIYVILCKKEIK